MSGGIKRGFLGLGRAAPTPDPAPPPPLAAPPPGIAPPPSASHSPEPQARIAESEFTKLRQFDVGLRDQSTSGWGHTKTSELIQGFRIDSTDVVADIGCGDGGSAKFCLEHGAAVVMCDMDADKIAGLRDRFAMMPKARALVSDSDPIPLPDGFATKVVSTEVMEHVPDPPRFLAELVRIGRPGAQYLISVPDPAAEHLQQGLAPDSYFEPPNHIRIIERDQFARWIEESGLVIESRGSFGFYWAMWWLFFWIADTDVLEAHTHPVLSNWEKTWGAVLDTPQGQRVQKAMNAFMPKSQYVVARKPL